MFHYKSSSLSSWYPRVSLLNNNPLLATQFLKLLQLHSILQCLGDYKRVKSEFIFLCLLMNLNQYLVILLLLRIIYLVMRHMPDIFARMTLYLSTISIPICQKVLCKFNVSFIIKFNPQYLTKVVIIITQLILIN